MTRAKLVRLGTSHANQDAFMRRRWTVPIPNARWGNAVYDEAYRKAWTEAVRDYGKTT